MTRVYKFTMETDVSEMAIYWTRAGLLDLGGVDDLTELLEVLRRREVVAAVRRFLG